MHVLSGKKLSSVNFHKMLPDIFPDFPFFCCSVLFVCCFPSSFFCNIGFVCCLKLRTCVNTQSWSLSFNSSSVDTNYYFFTKLNILSKEYVINLLLLIRVKQEWSKASFAVSETIFENEGGWEGCLFKGVHKQSFGHLEWWWSSKGSIPER